MYATGTQRQPMAVLSHLGITESYSNLTAKPRLTKTGRAAAKAEVDSSKDAHGPGIPPVTARLLPAFTNAGTLRKLSDSMRDAARAVAATGLYGTVYDNINMMLRNPEQIMGRTGRHQNITLSAF